jgi:Cu(I)/Ag(I) efflux system membrane fusion protein
LFYGLSNSQIESIKTFKRHTLLFTVRIVVMFLKFYRRQLCYGGGPIIKVADLSNLWLETQVNVSYAKI